MGPFGLVAFSTFCSALAVGVAWYSAQDFAQLMFFGVLFGMVAGGYSALWPRFICTLTSDEFANLFLYSLLAAGRGVGNLVASPLGILIMARSAKDTDKPQSQYRSMILFVAAAFLLSFFISVSSHALEWLRNRKPKPSQPSSPSV
jgi:MFS family permease